MLCANDYGSSQQMLPEPFETVYHAKEFLARVTVPGHSWRECTASIAYYTHLTVMFLLAEELLPERCRTHQCQARNVLRRGVQQRWVLK